MKKLIGALFGAVLAASVVGAQEVINYPEGVLITKSADGQDLKFENSNEFARTPDTTLTFRSSAGAIGTIPDGSITRQKLQSTVAEEIEDSVPYDAISFSDDDMVVVSHGGSTETLNVPT